MHITQINNEKEISKFIFVISVSTIFIYFLVKKDLINFNILKSIVTEKYNYIIVSSIFYILALAVNTLRFKYILNKFNIPLNYEKVFSFHIISIFFSQFLPLNTFFSEGFKVYFISKYYDLKNFKKIIFCTIFDKFLGLSSFFLIASFFLLIKFGFILKNNFALLIFFLFSSISCLIIPKIINYFNINGFKFEFKYGLEFFISLLSSILFIFSYYFIFLTTDLTINFYIISIVMPFIVLSFLIPIGYAGFGGYQFIAIFVFSFFENNYEIITSVSLIFAAISLIINSFLGSIFITINFNILKSFFSINKT